jgi:hypothetical protein
MQPNRDLDEIRKKRWIRRLNIRPATSNQQDCERSNG